jgi:hypothetical protein
VESKDASATRAIRLREDEDDKLNVGQCPRPSNVASGAAWNDEDDAKRVLLHREMDSVVHRMNSTGTVA